MTAARTDEDGITVRLPTELPLLTTGAARALLGILVELTEVEPPDARAGGSPDDC